MDTDSCYFAHSKSSLVDGTKPSMKEVFDQLINRDCVSTISYAPTLQNPYFHLVRTCCNEHTTLDNRTPGLFKLECSGSGIVTLCIKSYWVKINDGAKVSSKRVNKRDMPRDSLFDTYEETQKKNIPGKIRVLVCIKAT